MVALSIYEWLGSFSHKRKSRIQKACMSKSVVNVNTRRYRSEESILRTISCESYDEWDCGIKAYKTIEVFEGMVFWDYD